MGKKRAKEHYDFIRKQYHKEIANTTIHACESIEARTPQYQNNYSVTPKDRFCQLWAILKVWSSNFIIFAVPGLFEQGAFVIRKRKWFSRFQWRCWTNL